MMNDKRPTPEQMLERVLKENMEQNRGKLKIFLGAAPGVGKTFAMLQEALEKMAEGVDVVVGLVETHYRKETEKLLEGLEVMPRVIFTYHGKELTEFDLDGTLKRNPTLILVDEMAHTNAPGSRHTKRYQDIEELLDHGINVYTTMNILHLESVIDTVSQITGINVHETIPDSFLEMASRIELIDLPPENLIERLHEGKVYFPSQIELAADNFFQIGNLLALRELTLRTTADLVDTDIIWHRHDQSIKQLWPLSDRFLVCVNPELGSPKLVRAAKRLASHFKTGWVAVLVNTPRLARLKQKREGCIKTLHLAESLGAETFILSGESKIEEIVSFLKEHNITKLVVSKYSKPFWMRFVISDIVDNLIRQTKGVDIFLLDTMERAEKMSFHRKQAKHPRYPHVCHSFMFVFFVLSLATLGNFGIYDLIPKEMIDVGGLMMVYLLATLITAMYGQPPASFFAPILSIFLLDYFFIDPRFSFELSHSHSVITLILMLIVSQSMSYVAIRLKTQRNHLKEQAKMTRALFALTRQLARTRGFKNLLEFSAQHISVIFDSHVQVCVSDEKGHIGVCAGYPKISPLTMKERGIAQWVHDFEQVAGFGTETLSNSNAIFLPLKGTSETFGIVYVKPNHPETLIISENLNLLEALIHQIALTLEVDKELHSQEGSGNTVLQ